MQRICTSLVPEEPKHLMFYILHQFRFSKDMVIADALQKKWKETARFARGEQRQRLSPAIFESFPTCSCAANIYNNNNNLKN